MYSLGSVRIAYIPAASFLKVGKHTDGFSFRTKFLILKHMSVVTHNYSQRNIIRNFYNGIYSLRTRKDNTLTIRKNPKILILFSFFTLKFH